MAVTREEGCSDPKLETTDSGPGLQNPRALCVSPMQNAASSGNRFLRERKTETLRQVPFRTGGAASPRGGGAAPGRQPAGGAWRGVAWAWRGVAGKPKGRVDTTSAGGVGGFPRRDKVLTC